MAISLQEFVKATNAEEVGGNVIVGIMSTRKIVGKIENGAFNLNEEGQKIAAEIEAGTYDKASLVPVVEEEVTAEEVVAKPAAKKAAKAEEKAE